MLFHRGVRLLAWTTLAVCFTPGCIGRADEPFQTEDSVVAPAAQTGELQASSQEHLSLNDLVVPEDGELAVDEALFDYGRGDGPVPLENRVRIIVPSSSETAVPGVPKTLDTAATVPAGLSPHEKLRAAVSSLSADAEVRVILTVADPYFRWRALSEERNETVRDWIFDTRRNQAHGATQGIVDRLEALGARIHSRLWLVPAVAASVKAADVDQLLKWTDIDEVSLDLHEGQLLGYGGWETRNAIKTNSFFYAGYAGQSGGRWGGPMIVGEMEFVGPDETNPLYWPVYYHAGFADEATGFPRFAQYKRCFNGLCSSGGTLSGSGGNHGTGVLKILGGSIEGGQDPAQTNYVERQRRSGIISKALLAFYAPNDNACSSWIAGLQSAVTDGVDVLNSSASAIGYNCSNTIDCSGMNTSLANATSSGVLYVQAIGNGGGGTGSPPSCTVAWPAQRPETLVVAAVDTPLLATNFDTATTASYSSRGGANITINGSTSRGISVTDLSAPGTHSYWYHTPRWTYAYVDDQGTSFAAPTVAGAAALLRQHFRAIGWTATANNARQVLVNMLLMGDGYSYDFGGDRPTTFDQRSGAGRVHMHFPASTNLVAPWGWGSHVFTLSNGQTATFTVGDAGPENASIRQWKGAMTFAETNLANAADIDLSVWNTCPSGGGGAQFVAADNSADIRSRIELAQWQISGRCLEVRVYAYYIPAGQTRSIYAADYFHSGDPAFH